MTIEKVRNELKKHVGCKAHIKCNLGRNKIEKYDVIIKEIYSHIFLVELELRNRKIIKSYSYSDIITKTVKIDYSVIAF